MDEKSVIESSEMMEDYADSESTLEPCVTTSEYTSQLPSDRLPSEKCLDTESVSPPQLSSVPTKRSLSKAQEKQETSPSHEVNIEKDMPSSSKRRRIETPKSDSENEDESFRPLSPSTAARTHDESSLIVQAPETSKSLARPLTPFKRKRESNSSDSNSANDEFETNVSIETSDINTDKSSTNLEIEEGKLYEQNSEESALAMEEEESLQNSEESAPAVEGEESLQNSEESAPAMEGEESLQNSLSESSSVQICSPDNIQETEGDGNMSTEKHEDDIHSNKSPVFSTGSPNQYSEQRRVDLPRDTREGSELIESSNACSNSNIDPTSSQEYSTLEGHQPCMEVKTGIPKIPQRQHSDFISSGILRSNIPSERMDIEASYTHVDEVKQSTSNPEHAVAGETYLSSAIASKKTIGRVDESSTSAKRISKYALNAQNLLLTVLEEMMELNGEQNLYRKFHKRFLSEFSCIVTENGFIYELSSYLGERYFQFILKTCRTTDIYMVEAFEVLIRIVVTALISTVSERSSLNFDAIMMNYNALKGFYERYFEFWRHYNENIEDENIRIRVTFLKEMIQKFLLQTRNAFRELLMHIGEHADVNIINSYEEKLFEEDKIFLKSFVF